MKQYILFDHDGVLVDTELSSAVAAGIDCAVVHNDFTRSQDFSQASYRIDTLIELKDIVLSRPTTPSGRTG